MGGQVWGGGVIVLVAALLWLLYLLPTLHSRRQFDAAERNAVRLNQALRVLAETSETPDEVRLELNARTAAAQQRLARRAIAEREQAALEQARIDLERARAEREAARSAPEARRARARRRFRLAMTTMGLVATGLAIWGAWEVVATGSQLLLWTGVALVTVSALVLGRLKRVGARAAVRTAVPDVVPVRTAVTFFEDEDRRWAPRELPRPLTASAGSRASALLDAEGALEAVRTAALEESMRERAEASRPPSIDTARSAELGRKGVVDDAEIEEHVRRLLARRASGQ